MKVATKSLLEHHYMTKITYFHLNAFETLRYGESTFNCLLIITKGVLHYHSISPILLNKGDTLILQGERNITIKNESPATEGYIIEFHSVALASKVHQDIHQKLIRLKPFTTYATHIEKLYKQSNSVTSHEQTAQQIAFQKIWQHVIQACINEDIGDSITKVNDSIRWLQQYFMTKITVSQLALQANVSTRQYLRIFKNLTNHTPIAYINQYRIYRAQERLLQSNATVQEIALQVGFENVNYFNALFKQKVGCTPKAYIRLKQKNPRIITLHYAGELLALGITPIADIEVTWLQLTPRPKNACTVGYSCCDIDAVKQLQPDIVILSDAIETKIKTALENFVPVIVIPWDLDPMERLLRIAKILGKTVEVQQYITHYQQQSALLQQQYHNYYPTKPRIIILRLDEQQVWIHASRFFPLFYQILPFQPTVLMQETTEKFQQMRRIAIPYHDIASIEADRIYIVRGTEEKFHTWLQQLQKLPAWRMLSAVKNQHVYLVPQAGIANHLYNLQQQLTHIPLFLECDNAHKNIVYRLPKST